MEFEDRLKAIEKALAREQEHLRILIKRMSAMDVIIDYMQGRMLFSPPLQDAHMFYDQIQDDIDQTNTRVDGIRHVVQRIIADKPDTGRSIREVSDRVEENDLNYHSNKPTNTNWRPSLRLEDTE